MCSTARSRYLPKCIMQTPLRVRLLCPGRRKVFLAAACAVVIIASLSACSPLVLFSCVRLTSTAPQLRSRQPSATLLRSTASADVVDQVAVESNSDTGPSQEEISKKLKELEDLAEQGDIRAQFKLGKAFAEGKYVPQDLTRAFELLSSAADEGHNKARYLAGMMILNGEASYNGNSEEDVELALAYLTFSAEEGHIESQFHLSMMHFSGVGMDEEDNVGGFYWMKQAADRGHAEAQYHLGSMLFKGGSLNQNKTWAADYYRKSARQGFAKGQEALGLALLSGEGVKPNTESALRWLEKAADQRSASACYTIGSIHRRSDGIPKDAALAIKWLERAGDMNHVQAIEDLGIMYLTGEGTEIDEDAASYWFWRAEKIQNGEDSAG